MRKLKLRMRRRVKETARELDRVNPGWEYKINTSTLNLSCGDHCIHAQLYGARSVYLWPYEDSPLKNKSAGFALGYDLTDVDGVSFSDGYWREGVYLQNLWTTEIKNRRNEK